MVKVYDFDVPIINIKYDIDIVQITISRYNIRKIGTISIHNREFLHNAGLTLR
jgi:hypothetical protein